MTKEEVISLMRSSKDESDWNTNCRKVKAVHGGGYPSYWYRTIIQGKILHEVIAKWLLK